MIIKSMSRKTVSFKQLLTYINKENAGQMYDIHHNLYGQNQAELVEEFRSNAELLKKHKKGVVLYHEILSITKSQEISKAQQKQTLQTITETYINQRAPNNLVLRPFMITKSIISIITLSYQAMRSIPANVFV